MPDMTDFDINHTYLDQAHLFTVQLGVVRRFTVSSQEGMEYLKDLKPDKEFGWIFSQFCLVRSGTLLVAASDLANNIIVFDKDLAVKFKITNAHSRLISDLCWL